MFAQRPNAATIEGFERVVYVVLREARVVEIRNEIDVLQRALAISARDG